MFDNLSEELQRAARHDHKSNQCPRCALPNRQIQRRPHSASDFRRDDCALHSAIRVRQPILEARPDQVGREPTLGIGRFGGASLLGRTLRADPQLQPAPLFRVVTKDRDGLTGYCWIMFGRSRDSLGASRLRKCSGITPTTKPQPQRSPIMVNSRTHGHHRLFMCARSFSFSAQTCSKMSLSGIKFNMVLTPNGRV